MNNSINTGLDSGLLRVSEQSKAATDKPAADAPKGRGASGSRPVDQLDLTDRARSLKAIEERIRSAPDVDNQRITELKQALKDGTYEINPGRIAEKLLALDDLLPK